MRLHRQKQFVFLLLRYDYFPLASVLFCVIEHLCVLFRPFFLALFKHLMAVGQRGCNRTALELCKLLLRWVWVKGKHCSRTTRAVWLNSFVLGFLVLCHWWMVTVLFSFSAGCFIIIIYSLTGHLFPFMIKPILHVLIYCSLCACFSDSLVPDRYPV